MKRKLSLFLVIIMLLSAASCSETPDDIDSETDASAASETEEIILETEPQNPRMLIDDELPDETFEGKDFIIYTPGGDSFNWVEGVKGESVNDAVYNRNERINERFDVNIIQNDTAGDNNFVKKVVQAGTQDFHVANYHVVTMGGLVYQDMLLNWYDLEYNDFEKPWWYKSTREDLTINDTAYIVVGDFSPRITSATYAVYYNKTMGEKYASVTGNLYDTVREGKWTYDKITTISSQVYEDKDGNGKMDTEDFYGLSTDRLSNSNALLWAFGGKVFNRNDSGELEDVYYTDRTVEIFEAIDELFSKTEGVYSTRSAPETVFPMFTNFKSLFVVNIIDSARSLGDFDDDFGIVPMPKLNEEQEEYHTMADGWHPGISLPKTLEDTEFTSIIIEAISAENYKTVMPEYLDVCLKSRYADSPDDAEMIDLAVVSCVFDFGYIYDNWEGYSFLVETHLANKRPITSLYESRKKSAQNHYNKVFEAFGFEYDY